MGAGEKSSNVNDGFTLFKMEPQEIDNLARHFAMQYYSVMRKCPSGLHRFYKDDSAVIYEDATVFGQKFIHENFMNMNFHDVRIGILCLDALRCGHNNVMIQVSGEISKAGGDFRRFTQSFVLSEQAPCDFYVVNDIFKYQDHVYGDVKPEPPSSECNGVSSSHSFVEESGKRKAVPHSAEVNLRGNTDVQQLSHGNQIVSSVNVTNWKNPTYCDAPLQQPEPVIEERNLNEPEENTILSKPLNAVTPSPISQGSPISSPQESPVAPVPLSQPLSWAQMASQQASKPTGRAYAQSYQNSDDKHPMRHAQNAHGQVNLKVRSAGQRQLLDDKAAGAGDHGHGQDSTTARHVGPARIGSGGRGVSRGGRAPSGRGGVMAAGGRMQNPVPAVGLGPRRG